MPTSITGTVAWTADANTSSNFISGSPDASFRHGRGCFNAAETYYYSACRNGTGRVMRLDLTTSATAKYQFLYGSAFTGLAAGLTGCFLSADETKLYVATNLIAGTAVILEMNTDGSSGSPTTVLSTAAQGLHRCFRDPTTGYVFVGTGAQQGLRYTVPGTWAAPAIYFYAPNAIFFGAYGQCRYSPTDRVMCANDNNFTCYVGEYFRNGGNIRALAGNGVAGTSGSTGSAYVVATGNVSAIDSDIDGRIYYGEGANRVRRLEGGTISDVVANYDAQGGMLLLPTTNALLVTNSAFQVAKVT